MVGKRATTQLGSEKTLHLYSGVNGYFKLGKTKRRPGF